MFRNTTETKTQNDTECSEQNDALEQVQSKFCSKSSALSILNDLQSKAAQVSCTGFSSKAPELQSCHSVNWVSTRFILQWKTVYCTVHWWLRVHNALDPESLFIKWPRNCIGTQKSRNVRKHISMTNPDRNRMSRKKNDARQQVQTKFSSIQLCSSVYRIGCEQAKRITCLALNFVLKQLNFMLQNSIQVHFPVQKIVLHSSLISSGS